MRYYVPQIIHDVNVMNFMSEAISDMVVGYKEIDGIEDNLIISTSDIRFMDILNESIDFIFTDPPYAGSVQYGELNFVWESWLCLDTNWHKDEIIVNEVRGITEKDWANMMFEGLSECYRVLKPGRCISLCYHDTSEGTWKLIQDLIAKVGFIPEDIKTALFIDTKTKTTNQYFADKVNRRDLVINFRKPQPGERTAHIVINGTEDETTFNEKVWTIIREYLVAHPGSTKDRIYDEVVSRLVRAGKMEPHNFEELLRQVAEEETEPVMEDLFTQKKPDLFGTHERRRWYLKDTEEGAEEAELATEEEAASKIAQFLARRTAELLQKSQPQWEKLHLDQSILRKDLASLPEDGPERRRPRLRRDLKEAEQKLEKMQAQRGEWEQEAMHYSDLYEFYILVNPKPRKTLIELLEDFFYITDAGNWRPPLTDEERQEKAHSRSQAVSRKIQRLCRLLTAGEAIPADLCLDSSTLAAWIRHCKRSGIYEQGKLLFEKGGLNLDNLSEEAQVNVEEDYDVCVRNLARNPGKSKS